MLPVIHLRAAVSRLGRFPALAGVDLDVARAETVLLQGPNGAGKTTLLRALAGLVPFVAGEAVVLGADLRRHPTVVRTRVGLLGHATALYDDLTVAENVRFWSRAAGATGEAADEALGLLGLDDRLASVPVGKLSAGQRRRTALAVVVARRPELWLLDEPHAGLDQSGRNIVDGLIRGATAAGATVVVASHELERATTVADRIVTMAGGIVVSDTADTADTASPPPTPDPEIARVP
ncbi:MAG: heme ABC exporter ATP-binding protein CcmA [Acidimicrobiales bacterium]